MKRLYFLIKKLLGFRMMYGELAEIAGDGPCRRCVGQAVSGPVASKSSYPDDYKPITPNFN